jgi:hypothetical protein
MSVVRACALLVAAAFASLGPLGQGFCAMPGVERAHACCDGGADRVEPSCCRVSPAQPLHRVASLVIAVAAAWPADGACALLPSATPQVPSADRHWSHSPPVSILRI